MEEQIFEKKKQNRFSVEFPKEFDLVSWVVKSITKPYYSHGVWCNIYIDLIDPIGPSTSQRLFEILKTHQKGDLFEIKINALDPTGVVVEQWLVTAEEILEICFGNYDLHNEDDQILRMVIRLKDCVLLY